MNNLSRHDKIRPKFLNMHYYLIGAPGSGKTTVALHISSQFNLKHIYYRNLVHDYLKKSTSKAKKLKKLWLNFKPFTPKDAFDVLRYKLIALNKEDFILDGYPKSKGEAHYLADFINKVGGKKSISFLLDVDKDAIFERLSRRLVCPNCSYISLNPNTKNILGNFCPNCHVPLIQRKDDEPGKIDYRIKRYLKERKGIINEMSKISKLHIINATQPLAGVISDVSDIISGRLKTDKSKEAERGARMLVEGLGLDLSDPNIIGTPNRVVRAFKEFTKGINPETQEEIRKLLKAVFPTKYKGMVILEPIKTVSVCAHHLLPIEYDVLFGYIPRELTLGFSKIIKVINLIAAKPSIQEDFTQEVIEVFQTVLNPKGIMIVVRGKHHCMSLRGEKSLNVNITSAVRGDFKTSQKTRDEFLSLAKFS